MNLQMHWKEISNIENERQKSKVNVKISKDQI